MIVHEEQAGRGIARHKNVRPSVFVEVGSHYRHPVTLGCACDTRNIGYVCECAIAVISIKRVPAGWQSAGSAIHWDSLPVAGRTLSRSRGMFKREANRVGDQKIEMTI